MTTSKTITASTKVSAVIAVWNNSICYAYRINSTAANELKSDIKTGYATEGSRMLVRDTVSSIAELTNLTIQEVIAVTA